MSYKLFMMIIYQNTDQILATLIYISKHIILIA